MPNRRVRHLEGHLVKNDGAPSGHFYRMTVSLPEQVDFAPGQFAMVAGWPGTDPLLPRPLALFRGSGGAKGKPTVEFVYKVVGRGTALLSGLHPGDPISITAPLGNGFDLSKQDRLYWLVGGGVGFSSVFPAAELLFARKADADLFLGARSREELPPKEWTPSPGHGHGKVLLCTDDGTAGFHGTTVDAVKECLVGLPSDARARLTILSCGPKPMLAALSRLAVSEGIDAFVSLENHMACGYGVCWGCVTAVFDGESRVYRRVCREGPVFSAREVAW